MKQDKKMSPRLNTSNTKLPDKNPKQKIKYNAESRKHLSISTLKPRPLLVVQLPETVKQLIKKGQVQTVYPEVDTLSQQSEPDKVKITRDFNMYKRPGSRGVQTANRK